jgi:hypothetical protein
MRRSPVVRLDRSVARTSFALSDGACGGVAADANAPLELCRAGEDDVVTTLAPLEVDDDGRLVFAWRDALGCLAPGLYVARLWSQCAPCGEVLLQLEEPCAVISTTNVEYGPDCEGPDDTCAMRTSCMPDSTACDCPPVPVIYVPPYDVPRGC